MMKICARPYFRGLAPVFYLAGPPSPHHLLISWALLATGGFDPSTSPCSLLFIFYLLVSLETLQPVGYFFHIPYSGTCRETNCLLRILISKFVEASQLVSLLATSGFD